MITDIYHVEFVGKKCTIYSRSLNLEWVFNEAATASFPSALHLSFILS
jgi:hypothetical protein